MLVANANRFPVFCERELWVGWREGTFPHNISEYTCLITMCALSAQHAKNGALFNDEKSQLEVATWASEYLQEALSLVPMDFSLMNHLDLMRSYGFLALLGTQIGESSMVQKYLGLYHGICGRYGLHEESRWPPNISACDREVRRRIFWSIYRLEVHTACVLGHYVRIPEAQCDVGYPCGIHHPAFVPGRDGSFEDWFSGWNYSTDLYRILEHAAVSFRMRRRMHPPSLELNDGLSSGVLSKKLSIIKDGLLPQYERAFLRSEDNGRNRCGFQAANIFCIIHLVRMLTSLSDDHDLDSICDTAEEMIASMRQIPPEYVRACGATLLQQVAGVGHMLCVVAINEPPSTHSLHRLRLVLESITTFLETSKQHHDPLATAASRLREHLGKLRSADDVAGTGIMHPADEMGVPPTVEGHDSWISELDEYGTISGFGHEIFPATFLGDITWPFAWSSAPSLSD